MRVVVIGAGMIGASVAAELAEGGADTLLVERATPASGSSALSYGWINSNNKTPDAYFELNRRGIEAHVALARGSAEWYRVSGHLEIAVDPEHETELRDRVRRLQRLGYPARQLSRAQAHHREPDLAVPADAAYIAEFSLEGYCFPALYVAEQLRRAGLAGLHRERDEVVSLEPTEAGALVGLASGQVIEADHVVLAAGRWTDELLAPLGIRPLMQAYVAPGDVTMGYLAVTDPTPVRLSGMLTTPRINVRPAGGGALMLQALDLDVTARPGAEGSPELAEEFLSRLSAVLPAARGVKIRRLESAERAIPGDGLSVIGAVPEHPWLTVAATHSGATLAPYLGRVVAAEVIEGVRDPLLERFRPGRLSSMPTGTLAPPRKPGQQ